MGVKNISNINRALAVVLMVIMACSNPLQTLLPTNGVPAGNTDVLTGQPAEASAAEKKDPYVREVRLAVDKDAAKAKQILEDDGYEVIDQDLNEKAGSFWNSIGDQAVYMGFKRTADASKAIREMKTMNMLGKYSYTELKEWIAENKADAKKKCASVFAVVREYRENLKHGDKIAEKSREILDRFVEDDSGMKVGEFLISNSCDEESLIKILVEGNTDLVAVILKCLVMGAEDKNDTWLERLSMITKSSLNREYARLLYGVDKVTDGEKKAEIEKYLAADYDEAARTILANWDGLRAELIDPEAETELTDEEQGFLEEDEFLDNYVECVEKNSEIRGNILKDRLKELPYSGKSLYDLFSLNKSYFEKDITRLYPVAAAMTDGQRMMCGYSNLADLANLAMARINLRETGEADFSMYDEMTESIPECSVYLGIERDMFGDGAAMTSRATTEFKSAGADAGNTAWVVFGVSAFATVGLLYLADSIYKKVDSMKSELAELTDSIAKQKKYFFEQFQLKNMGVSGDWETWEEGINYEIKDGKYITRADELQDKKQVLEKTTGETYHTAKLMLAATIITAIIATTSFIIAEIRSHNRTQTSIPEIMVDKDVESDYGKYVAYRAVKWNRDRDDDTGRGDRGDLNGDAANQWLALYTTTDKTMGAPILADGIMVKKGIHDGDIVPGPGYYPITLFGHESVQNILEFSFNDHFSGIYIWYKRGEEAETLVDDTETDETEVDETEADDADETEDVEDADAEDEAGEAVSGSADDLTGSNVNHGSAVMLLVTVGAGVCLIAFMVVLYFRKKKAATIESKADSDSDDKDYGD